MNSNKRKAAVFTGAVTLIALVATMVLIGCSKPEGEKERNTSIEGVWRHVSLTQGENILTYPLQSGDGMQQPYLCFSEGKFYFAIKITESKDDERNGIFRGDLWEKSYTYTYAQNSLKIENVQYPFGIIDGNTAVFTMEKSDGSKVMNRLERVNSPTVAEIKGAKMRN